MAASATPQPAPAKWQDEPCVDGRRPAPVLHAWLTAAGLLTEQLRSLGADRFRLQVLPGREPARGAHSRHVLLWSGDTACIYARTDIPAATLAAHPWLAQLGNGPLGETLHARVDVKRSAFRFALLAPDILPTTVGLQETGPLWARRSDFLLGAHRLTVTEVFLSGLLALPQAAG